MVIPIKPNEEPDPNASFLTGLVNNPYTIFDDKLERLKVFYAKWEYEDVEKVDETLKLVFQ